MTDTLDYGATFVVSVTVNANLRAGPGTDFAIIGRMVTGQSVKIVARNADGSWFLLDNGGWVSAGLVINAPPTANIRAFGTEVDVDVTPALPVPLPTATLQPTDSAHSNGVRISSVTVEESLYLMVVDEAAEKLDQATGSASQLVNAAAGNTTIFSDVRWVSDMDSAVSLIRSGSDDIKALTPPASLAAAHGQMLAAASAFGQAADMLQASIVGGNVALLDLALVQVATAGTMLDTGRASLEAFR